MTPEQSKAVAAVICRVIDYHVVTSFAARSAAENVEKTSEILKSLEANVADAIQNLPEGL